MTSRAALEAVYARSDRMVGRRVADEFILVPIVGRGASLDAIYPLNRVGAFIWESLDGKRSGRAIVNVLVKSFTVERREAEEDYRAFLEQLLSIDAVVAVSG